MKIGILGSGFGLYGYLPALVELGEKVIMPSRYYDKLSSRSDVRHFRDDIEWVDTDHDVLMHSTALVCARRPQDQVDLVKCALRIQHIERYLLEKPVAPNVHDATLLLDAIQRSGKSAHIGFNFRHTGWAHEMRSWIDIAGPETELKIKWTFKAHHYRESIETWKRDPSHGGGVLRFYAIHLIALLAEYGYENVEWSQTAGPNAHDVRSWKASLIGAKVPRCTITVDSDLAHDIFSIDGSSRSTQSGINIGLRDPFDAANTIASHDRRINVVKSVCTNFLNDKSGVPDWCLASIELWSAVERQTETVIKQ